MGINLPSQPTTEETAMATVEIKKSFTFRAVKPDSDQHQKLLALKEHAAQGKGIKFPPKGDPVVADLQCGQRDIELNETEDGIVRASEEYTFAVPDMAVIVGEQFGDKSAAVAKYLQDMVNGSILSLARGLVTIGDLPTEENCSFDEAVRVANIAPTRGRKAAVSKDEQKAAVEAITAWLESTKMSAQGKELVIGMAKSKFNGNACARFDHDQLSKINSVVENFGAFLMEQGEAVAEEHANAVNFWLQALESALNPVVLDTTDLFEM